MIWTTEKPSAPGFYWVRTPNLSARVTQFYHPHGQPWLTCGYELEWDIYKVPVEYAGPIAEPEEPKGMTLGEIKAAVRAGKTVHWSNPGYVVKFHRFPNGEEQWLVVFTANQHAIGLTHADGVTMNGKPKEFFIADERSKTA